MRLWAALLIIAAPILAACHPAGQPGLAGCDTASGSTTSEGGFRATGCHAAPAGTPVVRVNPNGDIDLLTASGIYPAGAMDGGRILWAPDSRGFVVADHEGSGQTETFRYVDVSTGHPRPIIRLREAAVKRFAQAFRCRDGFYANTVTDGWAADGKVRLVVQNGVHSEGCVFADDNMIGVIGDPLTGAISRVLTGTEIRAEWCTPKQRADYGYCYEEEAFRRAHPAWSGASSSPRL